MEAQSSRITLISDRSVIHVQLWELRSQFSKGLERSPMGDELRLGDAELNLGNTLWHVANLSTTGEVGFSQSPVDFGVRLENGDEKFAWAVGSTAVESAPRWITGLHPQNRGNSPSSVEKDTVKIFGPCLMRQRSVPSAVPRVELPNEQAVQPTDVNRDAVV